LRNSPIDSSAAAQGSPVTVFIGSGENSVVERKVLIYSLHRHTRRTLDIRVLNGTHNAVERDGRIEPLPLPLHLKYRHGETEFGLCRYLVAHLMGGAGRALYLDSDIVCLADIGELFDADLGEADFLALPRARDATGGAVGAGWNTAVMAMDCARASFDLEAIFAGIARREFDQRDFMQMSPRFLARFPYRIGAIDPDWHARDIVGPRTRLVHYTDLARQPWRWRGHPYGALWFRYLAEARAAGFVADHEITRAIRRGNLRADYRTAYDWRERFAAARARRRD